MSHLPADFHRRLELRAPPMNVVWLHGVRHDLEDVEGDVLPLVGEDVLIHLASIDRWSRHTVTGFYAWHSRGIGDEHDYTVRLFVRVIDVDGFHNARHLKDVRRMDGTYFNNRSKS